MCMHIMNARDELKGQLIDVRATTASKRFNTDLIDSILKLCEAVCHALFVVCVVNLQGCDVN
jgi:hypothetical protein